MKFKVFALSLMTLASLAAPIAAVAQLRAPIPAPRGAQEWEGEFRNPQPRIHPPGDDGRGGSLLPRERLRQQREIEEQIERREGETIRQPPPTTGKLWGR